MKATVALPTLMLLPENAPVDAAEALASTEQAAPVVEVPAVAEAPPLADYVMVEPAEKVALLPSVPEMVESGVVLPEPPPMDLADPDLAIESVEPAPAEPARRAVWREPTALLAQLRTLADDEQAARWAEAVERQVARLGQALDAGEPSSLEAIARLESLAGEVELRIREVAEPRVAAELRRAGCALTRRLAVWKRAADLVAARRDSLAQGADREILALCLSEVTAATAGPDTGAAWRKYLMMEALEGLASGQGAWTDEATGELVGEVLSRLDREPETDAQRALLASGPLARFRAELVRWKPASVDPAVLLEHVELYEQSGMQMLAHDLAEDCRRLAASDDRADQALAQHLEGHYRNANFRLTVTQAMLDRFAPAREPERMPVRETMLGVPVRGRSVAQSEVALVLDPDPSHMRLTLEVRGRITASTTSDAGLATFFNDSASVYVARKPLEIDLGGIRLLPIEVGADSQTRLRRIETFFDPIPILGPIAQGIAEAEYDESKPRTRVLTRWRVASLARQRIEKEALEALTQLRDRMRDRVFQPLERLQVDPKLIEAETTSERLTMRIRMANSRQLGAHTPRPRAPADSLFSLQVHESALNNLLEGLDLGGQTLALPEVARRVSEKLNIAEPWEGDPDHDDVRITFPETDAVSVSFHDGKAVLTLSIARLEKAGRSWKNFQVHAAYVPQSRGQSAELVREDFIRMSGQVSTRAQIVLRGIFAKTFSKNRPLPIIPKRFTEDPRFDGVAVAQLVLDEGWLGVALGPHAQTAQERVEDPSSLAERPDSGSRRRGLGIRR